jgi:hypothetical protein
MSLFLEMEELEKKKSMGDAMRQEIGPTMWVMTLSKCANLLGHQMQSDVAREFSPQG